MEKCQNDSHSNLRKSSADVVKWACNPSTQEAETTGFIVQGQPGLLSETLPKKKGKKEGKICNFTYKYSLYLEWAHVTYEHRNTLLTLCGKL